MTTEPVLVIDFIKALLVVLAFVLPIPPGLDVALAALVVAVGALWQRSKVTPVIKP